jgi:glycosyltransferase involved in cell wall biosynthesis
MEGFGMPPLEAASCGAPVIVSDIPVFRELYSGYFVFVDPNDPEDLAVKIEKIERKDYSDLFRRFSWENSAKALYGLLKNWGFL